MNCPNCGSYIKDRMSLETIIENAKRVIDKDSTTYFMTEMTQKEFDTIRGTEDVKPYEFNKIKNKDAD